MSYTARNVVQVHAHWTSFTVASELKTMNPVLCHELRGREGVWWAAEGGCPCCKDDTLGVLGPYLFLILAIMNAN